MKKNLMTLSAVILAVAFSSFTTSRFVAVYAIYDGAGDQKDIANYALQANQPATDPAAVVLNWFRIDDNDGDVNQAELAAAFEVLDVVNDAANVLDDDAEIANVLDKKED